MNTPRFTGAVNADNNGTAFSQGYQAPAYASTLAVTVNGQDSYTLVRVGQLTGALTITAGVGSATLAPLVGDTMQILFSADATNRVVTFSTGFATAGTLTVVASKFGAVRFVFNGTVWQEAGRALTA
jgi:hypothetical protein